MTQTKYLLSYSAFLHYMKNIVLYVNPMDHIYCIPSHFISTYFLKFENRNSEEVRETVGMIYDNFIILESLPSADLDSKDINPSLASLVTAIAKKFRFTVYCGKPSELRMFRRLAKVEIIPELRRKQE